MTQRYAHIGMEELRRAVDGLGAPDTHQDRQNALSAEKKAKVIRLPHRRRQRPEEP